MLDVLSLQEPQVRAFQLVPVTGQIPAKDYCTFDGEPGLDASRGGVEAWLQACAARESPVTPWKGPYNSTPQRK